MDSMKKSDLSNGKVNYYSGISAGHAALNRESTMTTHGNAESFREGSMASRKGSVHGSKVDFSQGSPVNTRKKSKQGSSSMFDEDI